MPAPGAGCPALSPSWQMCSSTLPHALVFGLSWHSSCCSHAGMPLKGWRTPRACGKGSAHGYLEASPCRQGWSPAKSGRVPPSVRTPQRSPALSDASCSLLIFCRCSCSSPLCGFRCFSRIFLLRGRWCVSSLGLLRWDPRSVPRQRHLVVAPVLTASSVNPRSGFVMCPADPGSSFWAAAGSSCAATSPFSTQGLCSCCSPAWVPAQSHVLHRRGDGDHGCARCLLEFFSC